MKAIIKEDIIVNITERGNVEIGTLPKGVGVERLRWDGNKLVDLADLNEFWVRSTGGSFELHAVKVPNSQLVLMTYANRNNLILENSIIRIKTSQELQDEQKAKFNAALKAKLRTTLRNNIGDLEDLLMSTLVLVASLVVYSRTQNAVIGDWFDTMIPVIKDIFPQDKVGSIVEQAMQDLKVAINEYYDNLLE
jgi:hypothetical protein